MFVVVIFFWVGSEHKLEWSELLIKLFDLRTNEQTNKQKRNKTKIIRADQERMFLQYDRD